MATILNNKVNVNVINVTDPTYGAVGDGTTDDTAAIQAAIDAAEAGTVKTVYFPTTSAYYKCNGQLDLSLTAGITLMGDGGGARSTTPTGQQWPQIVYSGTASPFINIGQSYGTTFKDLAFQVSNASFTGDIVNSDWTVGGQVTFNFLAEDCYFGGYTVGANNAQSGLHLAGMVTANIYRCIFKWMDYGVIGSIGGDSITFSNEVNIERCTFDFLNQYGVAPTGSTQWSIVRNIFEQSLTNKPAGIINQVLGGGGALNGLKIIGNGFWDATVAGTYIDILAYGSLIEGNYFDLRGVNTGIAFTNGGINNSVIGNAAFGTSGSTFLNFITVASSNFTDIGNFVDAAVTYNGNPSGVTYASQSFLTTTTGGARFLGYTTSASTPTTTELPNNKDFCLHFDSGGSAMYLAYNLSGAIKKVALT